MASIDRVAPESHGPSGWKRLALVGCILVFPVLAGWGTLVGVTALTDYAENLQAFRAKVARVAFQEVRITPSDHTYHLKSHRASEGRVVHLGDIAEEGYKACWICRPTSIPPMPEQPRIAKAAAVAALMIVGGVLVVLLAPAIGLTSSRADGAVELDPVTKLPRSLPCHLGELGEKFDELQKLAGDLIKVIPGVPISGDYSSNASALAYAALKWAANWTAREVATSKDIQVLYEQLASYRVATPDGDEEDAAAQKTLWDEQQFQYSQLVWKSVERQSGRILPDRIMFLLEEVYRNVRPDIPADDPFPQSEAAIDHLARMLAEAADFLRQTYFTDSRLLGRKLLEIEQM